MEDALRLCGDYYERTLHLFDVTLGHFRDVTVGAGKVIFRNPMVRLDFGGFAKGYALRSVRRLLANSRPCVRISFMPLAVSAS